MKKLINFGKHSLIFLDKRFHFVSNDQMWFWEDEWQKGEKEVDKYIKEGKTKSFNTLEEFFDSLEDKR